VGARDEAEMQRLLGVCGRGGIGFLDLSHTVEASQSKLSVSRAEVRDFLGRAAERPDELDPLGLAVILVCSRQLATLLGAGGPDGRYGLVQSGCDMLIGRRAAAAPSTPGAAANCPCRGASLAASFRGKSNYEVTTAVMKSVGEITERNRD
jgi:hypothetical protein